MNKKQIVEIVYKLVKREVAKTVKSEVKRQVTEALNANDNVIHDNGWMNEIEASIEQTAMQHAPSNIQEALAQTEAEEYKTMNTFTSNDAMRSRFSSMQAGFNQPASVPIPDKDVNGNPLNPANIPDDLVSAFTKDYSKLVNHPKFKGNK